MSLVGRRKSNVANSTLPFEYEVFPELRDCHPAQQRFQHIQREELLYVSPGFACEALNCEERVSRRVPVLKFRLHSRISNADRSAGLAFGK